MFVAKMNCLPHILVQHENIRDTNIVLTVSYGSTFTTFAAC
jgi:hypothetical protein